jgi:hypothetical protein
MRSDKSRKKTRLHFGKKISVAFEIRVGGRYFSFSVLSRQDQERALLFG